MDYFGTMAVVYERKQRFIIDGYHWQYVKNILEDVTWDDIINLAEKRLGYYYGF